MIRRNYSLIHRNGRGEVHLGNGKIAVWLDEKDAIDMAHHYGPSDRFYDELMYAVKLAYPKEDEDDTSS